MDIFAQEMTLARSAGVAHPENYPFLLTPEKPNGHGVLLVHGFSATPREMRDLGEYLRQQRFTVYAVRLPGHGTSPEDLSQRCLEEWLATAAKGYQLLANLGLRISGAGLSTGALLLLKLALRKNFDALVLLSPYLKLRHPLAPFAGMLKWLIPYQLRDIPIAEHAFYYHRRPLNGVAQINRLRRALISRLPEIETPALILAAEGDRTVAPGTARRLFEGLGSQQKEFLCYGPDVPHVLTTEENPRQQEVLARTLAFIKQRSSAGDKNKNA